MHTRCRYRDGGKYVGAWKDSLRHGKGVMTYGDATVYDGDWEYNMRHGQGSCKFGNGDEYQVCTKRWVGCDARTVTQCTQRSRTRVFAQGSWHNDKQEGRGTMLYRDGAVYKGQWAKAMRNGSGTCTYANRDVYTGKWMADKRSGRGTCCAGCTSGGLRHAQLVAVCTG